jgi:EpsI family protein
VPIVANGLRAYMIVMIGHLSSMTLAVGFDHLIYGWLFFGLVMFLMFWVGSFWREPINSHAAVNEQVISESQSAQVNIAQLLIAVATTVLCIIFWPFYSNFIDRASTNPVVPSLNGFHSAWKEVPILSNWRSGFMPANAEFDHAYQGDGYTVGIALKYYRNQTHDSALISSSNQLVRNGDSLWRQISTAGHSELISDTQVNVLESTLQNGQGQNVLVWHWFWIDNRFTANSYMAKLLQAKEKFLMRGDDGAAIILYAAYSDKPDEARLAMRQFLTEHQTALISTLSNNKKH